MTVEEMRQLPETKDGTSYELRYGNLVRVTFPRLPHQRIARAISLALHKLAGDRGRVYVEFGFRSLPEHDARRADVAYISAERDAKAIGEDEFFGAPDLVVEILSRSNTAAEMDEKEALCFANGCREFWIVHPVRKTVKVTRVNEPVRRYGAGDRIEIPMLDGAVELDRLFE